VHLGSLLPGLEEKGADPQRWIFLQRKKKKDLMFSKPEQRGDARVRQGSRNRGNEEVHGFTFTTPSGLGEGGGEVGATLRSTVSEEGEALTQNKAPFIRLFVG